MDMPVRTSLDITVQHLYEVMDVYLLRGGRPDGDVR
jgi:hypothetical protein